MLIQLSEFFCVQDFIITSQRVRKETQEQIINNIECLDNECHDRRQLSGKTDLFTGQDIETFNGQVPEVVCGPGYYRPAGSTNLHKVTGL